MKNIIKGQTASIDVFIVSTAYVAYDFSGASSYSTCFKRQGTTDLTKTNSDGITNPAAGKLSIALTAAETAQLTAGYQDLEISITTGATVEKVQISKAIYIKENNC